jgi:hypothetical protein
MTIAKSALACLSSAGVLLAAALLLVGETGGRVTAAPPLPAGPIAAILPAQGGYGTIKGRLVWGGSDIPRSDPVVKKGDPNIKDPAVCGVADLPDRSLVVDPQSKGIKFAFAYLARPKGANAEAVKGLIAKAPKVEIDQKNCEFLPYSTAMHKDQGIVFKSSDPVGHNVRYSGFVNAAKNIALQPNGSLEDKLRPERLPMPLNCDIHPWMKGWIMVFDHPFFAVTGDDGSFEIAGVPAGEQNVVVWQERVGFVTPGLAKGQAVSVQAGKVTDVGEITLDPAKLKAKAAR